MTSSLPARSISLPSRSHPIADQFDEQISRLRSSQVASTSSTSITLRLNGLKNLFDLVDDLLLLPSNQQDVRANGVDIMLDGSLRLLDIFGDAKEALLQTKECIQNIQSVLRRRYSGEISIDNEIAQYLSTRKKVQSAIKNTLKNMKVNKSDKFSNLVDKFKDVEAVTVEIFSLLLNHIAGSKAHSKKNKWSLVQTLVRSSEKKQVTTIGEYEDLDAVLTSIMYRKKRSSINMIQAEDLRSQMTKLESEIQDVEEVLESLYRHLVKTRATLLNIFSN